VNKCWVGACASNAKRLRLATGAVLDVGERAKLERLRRENAELRLDRGVFEKRCATAVNQAFFGHHAAAYPRRTPHGAATYRPRRAR
jgi:hypothetical protein